MTKIVTSLFGRSAETGGERRRRGRTRRRPAESATIQASPLALEPRFMFDAAGIATVADGMDHTAHDAQAHLQPDPVVDRGLAEALLQVDPAAPAVISPAPVPSEPAPPVVRAADPAVTGGRREAVFIDTSVADYQTLVDGVRPGMEVVLLDGTKDGLAQISSWAEGIPVTTPSTLSAMARPASSSWAPSRWIPAPWTVTPPSLAP